MQFEGSLIAEVHKPPLNVLLEKHSGSTVSNLCQDKSSDLEVGEEQIIRVFCI